AEQSPGAGGGGRGRGRVRAPSPGGPGRRGADVSQALPAATGLPGHLALLDEAPRGRGRLMPRPPLPPELDAFLAAPNAAVVATLRRDGSPHTVATWYDWEDGRALLNMDVGRLRLAHMRRDQRVA